MGGRGARPHHGLPGPGRAPGPDAPGPGRARRGRRLDDLPLDSWLDEARARITAYMLKAARESKTRTSWTERDAQYEAALEAFVQETLATHPDDPFLSDVARLAAVIADDGA